MELCIDLDAITLRLVHVDDLSSLEVVVVNPPDATKEHSSHRLGDVISARRIGTLNPDGTVAVSAEVLRFLAAGEVDETWEEGLVTLLEGLRSPEGDRGAAVRWPQRA